MLDAEMAWLTIAGIAGLMVLGCLRVIACESHTAIARHELRVQVHRLRTRQRQRLAALEDADATTRRLLGARAARSLLEPTRPEDVAGTILEGELVPPPAEAALAA